MIEPQKGRTGPLYLHLVSLWGFGQNRSPLPQNCLWLWPLIIYQQTNKGCVVTVNMRLGWSWKYQCIYCYYWQHYKLHHTHQVVSCATGPLAPSLSHTSRGMCHKYQGCFSCVQIVVVGTYLSDSQRHMTTRYSHAEKALINIQHIFRGFLTIYSHRCWICG